MTFEEWCKQKMAEAESITEKQRNVIRLLEYRCDVRFGGKTRKDASEFISRYLPESKKISARNRMVYLLRAGYAPGDLCLDEGLPTYEEIYERHWDFDE